MGKAGEINPLGCDNENISYNSLMEIMGVVSERLQANTDTIKQDMINWLTKLRKQLLEANGGHTEADLQRELSRKSKLLDAYLDGILNKQEYQKKAEELDERIIQLKTETEKNKANSGDIAEIDKVLANIDEEVARYVDGNEKLKVEYLLEHLEQVQIFPDKVIVIVPILSEGIVVEKTQYVSREKRKGKDNVSSVTPGKIRIPGSDHPIGCLRLFSVSGETKRSGTDSSGADGRLESGSRELESSL